MMMATFISFNSLGLYGQGWGNHQDHQEDDRTPWCCHLGMNFLFLLLSMSIDELFQLFVQRRKTENLNVWKWCPLVSQLLFFVEGDFEMQSQSRERRSQCSPVAINSWKETGNRKREALGFVGEIRRSHLDALEATERTTSLLDISRACTNRLKESSA